MVVGVDGAGGPCIGVLSACAEMAPLNIFFDMSPHGRPLELLTDRPDGFVDSGVSGMRGIMVLVDDSLCGPYWNSDFPGLVFCGTSPKQTVVDGVLLLEGMVVSVFLTSLGQIRRNLVKLLFFGYFLSKRYREIY